MTLHTATGCCTEVPSRVPLVEPEVALEAFEATQISPAHTDSMGGAKETSTVVNSPGSRETGAKPATSMEKLSPSTTALSMSRVAPPLLTRFTVSTSVTPGSV